MQKDLHFFFLNKRPEKALTLFVYQALTLRLKKLIGIYTYYEGGGTRLLSLLPPHIIPTQ